jgi:hypothetical protein
MDIHIPFDLFPDQVRVGLLKAALKVGDYPFKGAKEKMAPVVIFIVKFNFFLS